MITIIEPKRHIIGLLSKPKDKDNVNFRLMRYILKVECDGVCLLHNVITGQLVVLDELEKDVLKQLPQTYTSVMEQLVDCHYLVPQDFDEHRQVKNIRYILQKMHTSKQSSQIRHYTILPTTACNARCYYCFEQGVKTSTMSENIADEVVEFIASQYVEGNTVSIMWFGGEPTVAVNRIDQISKGLQKRNIRYRSTMVSNAFLFDAGMVTKAKSLWNLKRIQVAVDGVGDSYRKTKNFVNINEDPYERVMRNVELLIDNGIRVDLRMNFDLENYLQFNDLLNEVSVRFKSNNLLQVYAFPVIGDYPGSDGIVRHGNNNWLNKTTVMLNNHAREVGYYFPKRSLPYLSYIGCGASDDCAITINADGLLVECPEQFENNQAVGSVQEGIIDYESVKKWKEVADYKKCVDCVFYPKCFRLKKCSAGDNCYFSDRNEQYIITIKQEYNNWKKAHKQEDKNVV